MKIKIETSVLLEKLDEKEASFINQILDLDLVREVDFIENEIEKITRKKLMSIFAIGFLFLCGYFFFPNDFWNRQLTLEISLYLVFATLVSIFIYFFFTKKYHLAVNSYNNKRNQLIDKLLKIYKENKEIGLEVFKDEGIIRKKITEISKKDDAEFVIDTIEYATYLITRKISFGL